MDDRLPNGWIKTTLGSLFLIERGGSPRPIEDYLTDSEDGINWIKIGDTKGVSKYIRHTKEKIKPEGLSKTRMVYDGDFLLSNSMSFGKPFIMNTSGCIHDGWLVIRMPKDLFSADYLYHSLSSSSVYSQFSNLAKGSTVKNLNIEAVQQVFINVPPLPEQHRIVAKIEELFASLDKGIEALKTAQQQLKVYRQAVLKYAFEGRLTHPELKEGELPEGWEMRKIGEIGKVINGDRSSNYPSRAHYVSSGIPFISAGNIETNELNKKSLNYIKKEKFNSLRSGKTNFGDIVYCLRGSLGKSAIIDLPSAAIASSLCILRLNSHYLPKYVHYYLVSPLASQEILRYDNGTAQPNLSSKSFEEFNVPITSIDQQKIIVQEIESRLLSCDAVQDKLVNCLLQAEALRQSILKKAFEGKLVPQDPNDEPASVLLERIRAGRVASAPLNKPVAKKGRRVKA